MKPVPILIAVTVVVLAGCQSPKKADESDKGSMEPAPMADMGPGDPAPKTDTASETATDTAEFARILSKNKALAKIMEGIKTLDDLKKMRPEYVKLNVDILKLTIASLKKAVTLSPKRLRNYVAKYTAMNKANAEFGSKLVKIQKRVMKIEGAKKYIVETQKALGEQLKPLTSEMRDLAGQYMRKLKAMMHKARQKEGVRSDKPGQAPAR